MTIRNGYCTLSEFKALITPSGQTLLTDLADDSVIEDMIERTSREFDGMCGRHFYPLVETVNYDVPDDEFLWFDDDLLEVISLTNGDGTAVATADYHFKPLREYPKYALYLTDITDTAWESTTVDSDQEAIALNAIWGYREQYATYGWTQGSLINMGTNLNATATTITVDSDDLFVPDQLIRIDNEIMIVVSSSSNDLVVLKRGDNGSTAAIHLDNAPVYYWTHPEDIVKFVLGMAHIEYKARFQPQVAEVTTYISPAGIVTNPRALPQNAPQMLAHYRRRV